MIEKHTIREWRRLKDLTCVQVAKRLGISAKTYTDWERCPARIRIGSLVDLCNALDIDPESVRVFNSKDDVIVESVLKGEKEE